MPYFDNIFQSQLDINKNLGNKFYIYSPFRRTPGLIFYAFQILFLFLSPFIFLVWPFVAKSRYKLIRVGKNVIFYNNAIHKKAIKENIKPDIKIDLKNLDNEEGIKWNVLRKKGFYKLYFKSILQFYRQYHKSLWFLFAGLKISDLVMVQIWFKSNRVNIQTIHFANHYDEWSTLFYKMAREYGFTRILYQHGIENQSSVFPKFKLGSLELLYCYSKDQADYFKKFIFDDIKRVIFFSPSIELNETKLSNTVLIVGHGMSQNYQNELKAIDHYLKNGMAVFYKPHPIFKKRTTTRQSQSFIFVNDVGYFPKVDKLVHFGSTLAHEYFKAHPEVEIINCERQLGN